jgi:hypothetical protein
MSVATGVGGSMTVVIEALCVIFTIAVGYGAARRPERAARSAGGAAKAAEAAGGDAS